MPRCSTGRSGSTAPGPSCESRAPSSPRRASTSELEALRRLAGAVAAFCTPQRPPDVALEAVAGVRAERRWLPLASVGIYVPGGRASYPSSLAMAAVPARLAGVQRIASSRRVPRGDPRRCVRARDRGGVRGGRRAGRGGARVRHGDDRARRQDRRPREPLGDGREAARRGLGRDRPSAGPSEVVLIADASASAERCAADLLAQAEHGPDSEAILLSLDPACRRPSARSSARPRTCPFATSRASNAAVELSEEHAPEHLELWVTDPESLAAAAPQRRDDLRPHLGGRRRLRGGSDACPSDGRPRAGRGRDRAGDLPEAGADRSGRPISLGAREIAPAARQARGSAAARRRAGAGVRAQPLPDGFRAYAWAPSSEEVAARHGLRPEQVLRYDQNTPPVPGVPQVPLGESFARLHEYPDGTYARAARGGRRVLRCRAGADRRRRRCRRADRLCARTYLGPGGSASLEPPTYGLYRIATELEGATTTADPGGSGPDLGLQPEQPDRRAARPRGGRRPGARASRGRGRRRRGLLRVRRRELRAADRGPAEPDRPAHALEGLRPGLAAGGLGRRRTRGRRRARAAPPAGERLGAGRASARQRSASRGSTSRTRSPSASASAVHSSPPATTAPPGTGTSSSSAAARAARRAAGGSRASSSAPSRRGSGSPCGGRARTTSCSPRSARPRRRRAGRTAFVSAHEHRDRASALARPRRRGRARVATGIGFLDHLLTLCAFHAGFDLELVAGGDLDVDEHHTVEDVCGARRRARRLRSAPARDRPLRRRDGADGRGERHRAGRPRAPAARGDLARLRRRPGRRPRVSLLPLRSSGWRCRARSPCTSRRRAPTTTTSRRPRSRRSAAPSRRRAPPDRRRAARRRASREGRARRPRRGQPRSVCSALARAGAEPLVSADPRRGARGAARASSRASGSWRGRRRARPARRRAARAGRRRPPGARDLRRAAAALRGERGGRRGLGLLRGPVRRLRAPRGAAHGLERAHAHRPIGAARRPRRRGRLLRAQLRRRADRRRRRSPRSTTAARSSPPSSPARSPASSSTPSAAAPPAPACSRTRCDGQEARDPLPRRRRRAASSRASASRRSATSAIPSSWRSATRSVGADELVFLDITATVEGRGPTVTLVERAAERLTIPFTVGGGIGGLEDARRCSAPGADKVAVNRAAFDEPGAARRSRTSSAPRPSSARSTRAAARSSPTAAARPRRRRRRLGARGGGARRGRAARHLDRRRRDAATATTWRSRRRSPRRSRCR